MTSKVRMVVATRVSQADFLARTATGRSLRLTAPPAGELRLFPENTAGLPAVYNQAIREAAQDPAVLVFAHDDLHLADYFWHHRILEAVQAFDIVGVAGNLRRVPRQPSWAFVDTRFTWDIQANLSAVLAHGKGFPPESLAFLGQPRQRVKLLDGLLLAADSRVLLDNELFFDERFDFHFYDLDFCRQAELKGLSCGTWDLSLVHESGGNFGSERWKRSYVAYLEKWGE